MPTCASDYSKDIAPALGDGRLDAPAFHRNHKVINEVLARHLPPSGDVLEIGSGTGQHIVGFAEAIPNLTWWPSDPNPTHRTSIAAWSRLSEAENLKPPSDLDAAGDDWGPDRLGLPPAQNLAAIICINVLHIARWAVTEGVLAGAGRHLKNGACLYVYGPFMRDGSHVAPSNAEFDTALRQRDPTWGVRDIADLERAALKHGLELAHVVEMPSNNFVLVLTKPGRN